MEEGYRERVDILNQGQSLGKDMGRRTEKGELVV